MKNRRTLLWILWATIMVGTLSSIDAYSEPIQDSATLLLLNGNRFEVTVDWKNYGDGSVGQGAGIKLSNTSGYFWFFDSGNPELVIKVLDGSTVNGCFWVIYGALTDLEYTIRITDTKTGATKRYHNPPHNIASRVDLQAFPWSRTTNPPTASFQFSPTSPTTGQTVQFTDKSTGAPTSWRWSFGDGITSELQSPIHIYSSAGLYTVTLTSANASGSNTVSQTIKVSGGTFSLTSSAGADGGTLPIEYTCDGSGSSPALSWSNPPAGTKEFALLMTTLPGDGTTKWNWVLYRLPATTTSLAKNSSGVGILGVGSDGPTMAYQPPCSQGPGSKLYTFTLYALSASPQLPTAANQVTGSVLSQAISSLILGSASLKLSYSRNSEPGPTPETPGFSIEDTISDQAQSTTLAFSGLAMMTGNLEAQSFFPPGKVADYTGFQYLRDNDPDNMGHNTSFLTRIANNIIYLLNDTQFNQLKALAVAQIEQINLYGYKRFPLMKAFRRLMDEDIPSGSAGLNLNAVKKASRELYALDGQISFDRALLYANLIKSLDTTQKGYLEAMKGKGWNSWPDITDDQIRSRMQGLPQGTAVAVMTYASDLFSWYAGSVEADVYFCPERQGTYYGSFYIKDAPAIGHEGYGINEQLTATAGSALCDSSKGYVTQAQASLISSLVDKQRANLYASSTNNIVKVRTEIATLLRGLLSDSASVSAIQEQVLEWSGIYGDLDGENNYYYATVFAQVYKTLTTEQKTKLATLRKSIMSGTYADGTPFDYSLCTTPFLYSSVITDLNALSPYISNTDLFFFEP